MEKTLTLFVCFCFILVMGFPENLTPRTQHYDAPTQVFTGSNDEKSSESLFLQNLKVLKFGTVTRIAVSARENLYLLDPYSLQATNGSISSKENYGWISEEETQMMCLKKGQSPELCRNYLSVMELPSNEEMLLCGTNAFDPKCRFTSISMTNNLVSIEPIGDDMSGRQRSPFGPNQPSTSLFTDGSFYSATYQSFFGGAAILSRTMGSSHALRTDSSSDVMNKPHFIKMIDDGKRLLIFFNEVEVLAAGDRRIIPQVAQVCKNDKGGDRILLGLFTTFIKSRLNCSYNGFYLNRLTDLTDPINVGGELTVFATFATPENSLAGSAVCAFSFSSIQATLAGPFLVPDTEEVSVAESAPSSTTHPGLCSNNTPTNAEMLFVKSHPQMQKQVPGTLLLTNQGQRWTSIQVQNINGQQENVIFVGTENGHLIRALSLSPDIKQAALISDQDVFNEKRCSSKKPQKDDRQILRILIENKTVFVAFKHCVITLPLQWCKDYGCESACRGSGDPYCGWKGKRCVPRQHPVSLHAEMLEAESRSPIVCPQIGVDATEAAKVGLTEIHDSKISGSTTTHNALKPITPAELGKSDEKLYPFWYLIIVGLATFIVTLILVLLAVHFCRKRGESQSEEEFKKKQTNEIHQLTQDDEKRNSFHQRLQKLLCKATSPTHTPQVSLKSEKSSQPSSRSNVYSEAPCLKKSSDNGTKGSRRSGRLNSASSGSSRQDHCSSFLAAQPLLPPSQESRDSTAEMTLPHDVAEAARNRHISKVTSDVSTTSSSSPTRSSVSSPTTAEVVPEAPNTSAQVRRRSERAAKQTTEIMRDSNKAIRAFESTFERLEEQGIPDLAISNLDTSRSRIGSNDSGKGESPQNSLKTNLMQNDPSRASRLQRPMSLNVRSQKANGRHRLLSEGSSPHETNISHARPQRTRERHYSGQQLVATSPVGVAQRSSGGFVQVLAPMYGSLQRHDDPLNMQVQQQHINYHPPPPMVRHSHHQGQPYEHNHPSMLQRQMSEPHNRVNSTRVFPGAVPPQKSYPAFQETAPPHQMIVHSTSIKPPTQTESPTKINYYPSLPYKNSSAPYGDNSSYPNGTGFEKPSTLQRKEKIPPLMRQLSTPNGARTAVYAHPPSVLGNEMV